MQNTLANFIGVFSLVRGDRGFQVNPLCCHDITSPFPPSGNGGYVRNPDVLSFLVGFRCVIVMHSDVSPAFTWQQALKFRRVLQFCYRVIAIKETLRVCRSNTICRTKDCI